MVRGELKLEIYSICPRVPHLRRICSAASALIFDSVWAAQLSTYWLRWATARGMSNYVVAHFDEIGNSVVECLSNFISTIMVSVGAM